MARSFRVFMLVTVLLAPLLLSISPQAKAQGPCGVVDAIDPPLDTSTFSIVYRYGVPSSRFDGRYHAGEDWFGSRTATYGSAVRAAAKGRVTYAAPLGWGRDKGVVIIEHLMPDGTWWYSLYGHMEELNGYDFPTVYTCVDKGAIIGAIGRPRPAPHLHFEIRSFGSDSPGPGYWATDPDFSGWRNPSKFIQNWQAWLNPAHAWHGDIADDSGPHYPAIIRQDNATIVYDDRRLKALNPAGQILWRYIIPEQMNIVGVLPYQGDILVADYSGIMQRWSITGGFIDQWQLPHGENSKVFLWGDLLIVHTQGNTLVAYGPDLIERWRVSGILRPVDVQTTNRMLAVASIRDTVTFIGLDGRLYDQATLRTTASIAPAPDDGFIVRTRYGLWRVDTTGQWARLNDSPFTSRIASTIHSLPDGRFFLFSGTRDGELVAYSPEGEMLWQQALPGMQGNTTMFTGDGSVLLIADGYGQINALSVTSGEVCSAISVWGNRAASSWIGLGPDGVLRVHIADQVIGLDWDTFTKDCI
jgi:murein DD-endopeptidase MepM/ murein hydrolase activator NlpD